MDARIPKPAINVTIDVPPALTKGKGTPTMGNSPETMPEFTNTYTKKVKLSPPASSRVNVSWACDAIYKPLPTSNK